MMINTFTKINPQGVRSLKGFVVQHTRRNELQYTEGDHILSVEVESGINDSGEYFFAVYVKGIKSWMPPHENEDIIPEKKSQIIRNIIEALNFLGDKYVID